MSLPCQSSSGPDAPIGSGWTCPVCFFYCQADWIVCPVCDYIRPDDMPMDGQESGFCILKAAGATR